METTRNRVISSTIRTFIIIAVGIFLAYFVFSNPISRREGLDQMWILPIFGCLMIADLLCLFDKIQIGIGVYIFLAIVGMKYLMMPLLMAFTGGSLHFMKNLGSMENNEYSVIVMLIELAVSWMAIKYFIPKYDAKIDTADDVDRSRIANHTWFLIAVLLLICIVRRDRFINDVHFFSLSSTETTGSYEQIILQVLKSFLCIRVFIFLRKKYKENNLPRYFIIAILVGLLNCGVFFGINRSLILQTSIATIAVLINLFPNYKKETLRIMVPLIAIMLLSITLLRHFGTTFATTSSTTTTLDSLSQTLEEYVCGPWSITSTVSAADKFQGNTNEVTFIADVVCNFFPFMLPGLDSIRTFFFNQGTISSMYNSTINNIGSMIPMIGECNFFFGRYLGILADVMCFIWAMKVLVKSSFQSTRNYSAELKFYYTWVSSLFAFTMCYCMITFLWSWSKFGMIYFALSWFNRKIVFLVGGRNIS